MGVSCDRDMNSGPHSCEPSALLQSNPAIPDNETQWIV